MRLTGLTEHIAFSSLCIHIAQLFKGSLSLFFNFNTNTLAEPYSGIDAEL